MARFLPGQSGNLSGRPHKDNELKKLCKGATADSFARILTIAKESEEEATRLKANQWICEYAFGKPSQSVDLDIDSSSPLIAIIKEGKQSAGD